ncbi:MAG TPA: gliding motility protein GldC [Cytophaga sp.]|nr:gliding motility protein GldC [Cytophaga sp.]
MKNSEIKFSVTLDDHNIPEAIVWEATDGLSDKPLPTDAIALSLWDHSQMNTMQINIWTKEMPVEEMKRFAIEGIGGMADSIENATGDIKMAEMIRELCKKLVVHVKENTSK